MFFFSLQVPPAERPLDKMAAATAAPAPAQAGYNAYNAAGQQDAVAASQVNNPRTSVPDGTTVYNGAKECGEGERVQAGRAVTLHFVSEIDGSQAVFGSTIGKEPVSFTVGQGTVIRGVDEGIIGLCPTAQAEVIIPPDKGLGTSAAGDAGVMSLGAIPPGATLKLFVQVCGGLTCEVMGRLHACVPACTL